MLEQDDREVEGELERAELRGGRGEPGVGGRIVAGETGAEAMGGCVEERRPEPGGQLLDEREQLVRLGAVAERERGLERHAGSRA